MCQSMRLLTQLGGAPAHQQSVCMAALLAHVRRWLCGWCSASGKFEMQQAQQQEPCQHSRVGACGVKDRHPVEVVAVTDELCKEGCREGWACKRGRQAVSSQVTTSSCRAPICQSV